MNRWRSGAAVAVAIGLAGCGGSHRALSVSSPAEQPPQTGSSSPLPVVLPASQNGPTSCTVYESGFGTQVIFGSRSLNVSAECQAWTGSEAGAGYLWGYQPAGQALDATAVGICSLRDPTGRVTASVVEDTGFTPISATQRARSDRACASMRAGGWVPLTADANRRR